MKSLFNLDNPVMRLLGRIFDVAYLNVLCLVCCIPIITIGPSITALYYCMLKILRKEDSTITRMFLGSFKANLKQGIGMTILFIGFAIILLMDLHACNLLDVANIEYIEYVRTILYVIFAIYAVVVSYAFPILAQFDNTIINILKYSILLAIYNFGYTFWIVILNIIPIAVFVYLPELFLWTFPAWLTFGFATIALINSKMFVKIFDKFMPENSEDAEE